MLKKILILIAIMVIIVVIIEIIALLHLKSTLTSYKIYWDKPQTGTLTYVALGDSAAQGIGASQPTKGYVGLLADQLANKSGESVKTVNLSVSGATIDDVIEKQIPQLKNYRPDVITIDIGGNDVARQYNSQDFKRSFDKLGSLLPAGTYVGNMPYFGGRIKHNPQALDANEHILATTRNYNLKLVDLQTVTKNRDSLRNYASDYFHPSNRGYQNWADAYWQKIVQNDSGI